MRTAGRIGSHGGRSRFAAIVALLLAAVLVGCRGSRGATAIERTSGEAAVLAAEIDGAQAVVDDPAAPAASVAQAAFREQLAFRQLAADHSLRRRTLARLSPAARSAATAALRAADALARIVPAEHRFPRWHIVDPPTPRVLLGYFRHAGARYRVGWQYLAAIALVETRMGRIHGLSPAGAQGPMQFMPATWAIYGRGDIDSPHDSILAAARFLAAAGARTSIRAALFHYNPSGSYVTAVEAYAREMKRNPRAFCGYYWWQVLYRTSRGTFLLPVGYPRLRPERLRG